MVIVVKCHFRLCQYQSSIRKKSGKSSKPTGDWSPCLNYWCFGAGFGSENSLIYFLKEGVKVRNVNVSLSPCKGGYIYLNVFVCLPLIAYIVL